MQIARLDRARLTELLAIERQSFPKPWPPRAFENEFSNPRAWLAGAFLGERLAGYALAWDLDDRWELMSIAVDPSMRRQGVGRALLGAALEATQQAGAHWLDLEVRENNREAIALYRAFHGEPVGRRKNYYEQEGIDALLFRLPAVPDGSRGG